MARITRQTLREADPTFTWKLVLRSTAIIFAAIAIGLVAWAQLHTVVPNLVPADDPNNGINGDDIGSSGNFAALGDFETYNQDNYELSWEYISLGLSMLWNFANIGVWFTPSRAGRGMHPGANVGCDLVLWLILIFTGVIASFDADMYISQFGEYLLGYSSVEQTFNNDTLVTGPTQCAPFVSCDALAAYGNGLRHKGIVIAAGLAFTFIVMLFHFALFISACRYTHARRNVRGGRYAKAVTDEATVLAGKMVREMGYVPASGPQPTGQMPMSGQQAGGVQAGYATYQPTEAQHLQQQAGYDATGKGKGREDVDLEQGHGGALGGNAGTASGEASSSNAHQNPDIITSSETSGPPQLGMIR